jgi:hypothetical protein
MAAGVVGVAGGAPVDGAAPVGGVRDDGCTNGSRSRSGGSKAVAGGRKLRYIGRQRDRAWFVTGGIYNVLRIVALDAAAT